ncbi:MAG: YgaP family membrane protein [Gemmatimonadaceae bacterium]
MCNDALIRRIAGLFVMASVALGIWVNPAWFLFTVFVGFNLFQSSLSGFCPLERILGWAGLFGCEPRRD